MNVIFWKIILAVSSISIIAIMWYVKKHGRRPIFTKALSLLFVLIILGLGYRSYLWYNREYDRPFLKIESKDNFWQSFLPTLLRGKGFAKEYLKSSARDSRPVMIATPIEVQVRFTDPINPRSPHGVLKVLFANK